MTIKSAQIAQQLGFLRHADEPEAAPAATSPTSAPKPAQVEPQLPTAPGDLATAAPPQAVLPQSSTGTEALPMSQVEQLRQVLTELIGDEDDDDDEAFEPSYTPAKKNPDITKRPNFSDAPTEPGSNVFRAKTDEDESWIPLAKKPSQVQPNKGTDVLQPSKVDSGTSLLFSKDPREQ